MNKGKVKVTAMLLGFGILSGQAVFAEYSEYATFQVTPGDTKVTTTAGTKLGNIKNTEGTTAYFYSTLQTMYSQPEARIVNSDNAKRSDFVDLVYLNEKMISKNNIGTPTYKYYAQVKGDYLQYGTDSVKLKFDPR